MNFFFTIHWVLRRLVTVWHENKRIAWFSDEELTVEEDIITLDLNLERKRTIQLLAEL